MSTALTIGCPVGNGKTWGDTTPGDTYRHPDGATFRVVRHRKASVVVENFGLTDDDGRAIDDSTDMVPKGFPLNPDLVFAARTDDGEPVHIISVVESLVRVVYVKAPTRAKARKLAVDPSNWWDAEEPEAGVTGYPVRLTDDEMRPKASPDPVAAFRKRAAQMAASHRRDADAPGTTSLEAYGSLQAALALDELARSSSSSDGAGEQR